eukprot:sb/3466181/
MSTYIMQKRNTVGPRFSAPRFSDTPIYANPDLVPKFRCLAPPTRSERTVAAIQNSVPPRMSLNRGPTNNGMGKKKGKTKEVKQRTVETVCGECGTDIMHWKHFAAAGRGILVPDWLITSHVTLLTSYDWSVPATTERLSKDKLGDIPKFKTINQYRKHRDINRRIFIHDGSVTELECDVIAVSIDTKLSTNKLSQLIKYAGEEMATAASKHSPQPEGSVVEIDGFNMAAGKVILAVTPAGRESPENIELLRQCYVKALEICKEKGYRSIAFAALGSDSIRIDSKKCARVALKEMRKWMEDNWQQVDSLIICRYTGSVRSDYDLYLHNLYLIVRNWRYCHNRAKSSAVKTTVI